MYYIWVFNHPMPIKAQLNKISLFAAKAISYCFHPLLLPTLGLFFIFHTHSYLNLLLAKQQQNMFLMMVALITILMPVLSSGIMLLRGHLVDFELQDPKDRRIPYFITAIYYAFGYYMLVNYLRLPRPLGLYLLGATLAVTLSLLITLKWKISAHGIGVGGLVGGLLGFAHQVHVYIFPSLYLALVIAGLVGYARLKLNAHNPAQLYTGFLLGFLCEFLLFRLG